MRNSTLIKQLLIVTAGAALIVIATAEAAAAASFYAIADLGNWSPTEMNNVGQVVGSQMTASGDKHAVLWENSRITDLGTLGSNYKNSRATAINDRGQIVGTSYNYSINDWPTLNSLADNRSFLWQNGTMIELVGTLYPNLFPDLFPDGNPSQAIAINNAGQVINISYNKNPNLYLSYRSSFLWQNGKITDLHPSPYYFQYGYSALGINDAGEVVGYYGDIRSAGSPAHAFVWKNGSTIPLGMALSGIGNWSIATHINNKGQVIVETFDPPWYPYSSARNGTFLLDNCSSPRPEQQCQITKLDLFASDLNDLGQVVGYSHLWENGIITDLNSLLPINSGWTISEARAINNLGQIVGIGLLNGQSRAFLMTPADREYSIPEPSAGLGLLAFGVFGAAAIFKRQQQ